MFYAFMPAPTPMLIHKANSKLTHSVDPSKTKSVFDFLLNQKKRILK